LIVSTTTVASCDAADRAQPLNKHNWTCSTVSSLQRQSRQNMLVPN
jgi:hypothetical protein